MAIDIVDDSIGIVFKINGEEYAACFTVPEDKRTEKYVSDQLWIHTDAAVGTMLRLGFIRQK